MKLNKIIGLAALTLVGCNDDLGLGNQYAPAAVGEEILFGGTMTFDNGTTRTVYGDESEDHSATEILWYEGDMVRIYCAQAGGSKFCDYTVTDYVEKPVYDEEGSLSNKEAAISKDGQFAPFDDARLQRATDEVNGLHWGSEGVHTFYGVYPSPDMFEAGSSVSKAYSLNENLFTGYLPPSQSPTSYLAGVKGNGGYTAYTIHPAMRFAYMMAKGTAAPSDGYCNLIFNPIVTAVEFTLINNAYTQEGATGEQIEEPIEDISLVTISSTDSTYLCGTFNTDIDKMTTSVTNGETSISVPVQNEKGLPITLNPHDTLRFTIFMLPNDGNNDVDLKKIKITVQTGFTFKTSTLSTQKNNGILVEAKKKNFLAGIDLKWNVAMNISNWVSQLSDDSELGNLSIPGAGGTGSHDMSEGYNQQTLDIEDLWNRGIRCFEVFTNKGSSTTDNLGNQFLVCNGRTSTTTTLSSIVNTLQQQLEANPREFAILIVGYEPTDYRSAPMWQGSLKTYWEKSVNTWEVETEVKNDEGKNIICKTALYSPTMKLAEARGKLFCFSRPTTIGRDQWWYSLYDVAENVIPILGWGPSPDAWYSRGYTRIDRPYYINTTGDFTGLETTTPINGGTNYMYPSYLNALAAAEDGTLNSSGQSDANSSSFTTHLSFEHNSSTDDKFMYRVCSNELYNNIAHCYTILEDYNTLRVYAQDWRRVAKEPFYSNTSGEVIAKSYKVYIYPNISRGNSTTINSVTLTYNGNEYSLSKDGETGYYIYDFGREYTGDYTVTVSYSYRSYYNRTATTEETFTGLTESMLHTVVYSSNTHNWSSELYESSSSSTVPYYYYWPSSLDEKKNDIVTALDRSTSAPDRDYTIYINSLCGFYIDSQYESSYKPDPMRLAFIPASSTTSSGYLFNDTKYNGTSYNGVSYADYYTDDSTPGAYDLYGGTQGDIQTFSSEINQFFYEKLLEIGASNLAGPTGIIMMDRVSNNRENAAGYYLPQIIVANNFKWNASSSTQKTLPIYDETNEDPQYAPATRDADDEEGPVLVWE